MLSGLEPQTAEAQTVSITDNLFNRIFGNGKIEIRPQGNVDIIAGTRDRILKTRLCRKEQEKWRI